MNSKNLESYLGLSTQFYDLIRPETPENAYSFYRSYASEANGKILEPMCGSGRFLIPLVEEGFDVSGFDASEYMLKALQDKAASKNLSPKIWHDYVGHLDGKEKYNLIFIPSGSFGHIIKFEEIRKSLENFYANLNEDGILVFEAESSQSAPLNQLGVWRGMVCNKPDGNSIIISRLSNMQDNVCYSIDKYELLEKGSIVQSEIEKFNVRLYDDRYILLNMLLEVGFQEVNILKAYDRNASPDDSDAAFVYECRK